MSIFNKSQNYYAFRRNYENWGHGPIYDNSGNIIAKYHHYYNPQSITVMDLKNFTLFKIIIPKFRIPTKYRRLRFELWNHKDLMLYKIRERRTKTLVELSSGELILQANMDSEVFDKEDRLVAMIKHTYNWPEIFKGTIFEFRDTIGIKINKTNIAREAFIGLALVRDWISYANYCIEISTTTGGGRTM